MVKKISMGIGIILVLVVAYNLFNQILNAVKSGERLSKGVETIYQLEQKNKELKERLAEVKSERFLEEQVRNKLGMAKKGEIVVVIPEERIKQVLGASQAAQIRLPNWLGWLKVFWH